MISLIQHELEMWMKQQKMDGGGSTGNITFFNAGIQIQLGRLLI